MKIASPIDRLYEVEELIAAGAGEFFCGVVPSQWLEQYTYICSSNMRPSPSCNVPNFSDFKKIINIAHQSGVPVFYTLNDHMYTEQQYPMVYELMSHAVDCDVDGFIISDVALLLKLFAEDTFKHRIHISLGASTFNSRTARFYQSLGAERVVTPEDITLEEIRTIKNSTENLEIESFIMSGRCLHDVGFCTYFHGLDNILNPEMADKKFNLICEELFETQVFRGNYIEEIEGAASKIIKAHLLSHKKRDFSQPPCGACALWEMREIGVEAVKIVGRGYPKDKKAKDVKFLKTLIDLLEQGNINRNEFRRITRELNKNTYKPGLCSILCYYPTVMVDD